MATGREAMTGSAECAQATESVLDAAKKMAELGVGALPICGEDERLKGMLTDRDIVVKVLAGGEDPASATVESLAEGKPVTIGADDSISEAIKTMADHKVRRLPVIDGHDLVGVLSQADIARVADDETTGKLLEAISQE